MTIEQNANKVNDYTIVSLEPLALQIVSNNRKIFNLRVWVLHIRLSKRVMKLLHMIEEKRSRRYLSDEEARADFFIVACNHFVTIYLLFRSGDTLGAM